MTPYFEAGKKHVPIFLVIISQISRVVDDVYMTCMTHASYMEVCVCVCKKCRRTTLDSMPLRNDFQETSQVPERMA